MLQILRSLQAPVHCLMTVPMLQATNYAAAANALPTPATSAQIEDVKNKLLLLFGTGTDLGKRLADVSNILQALRDLSALHADSASSTPGPAGALQALVDDLTS